MLVTIIGSCRFRKGRPPSSPSFYQRDFPLASGSDNCGSTTIVFCLTDGSRLCIESVPIRHWPNGAVHRYFSSGEKEVANIMKIGLVSFYKPGHFNPMSAVARQLQARNHDVVMLSLPSWSLVPPSNPKFQRERQIQTSAPVAEMVRLTVVSQYEP